MTDDSEAFRRRCNLIARIEANALEGAKGASGAAWQAERIIAITEEYLSGRRKPTPEVERIARRIGEIADRISRERGWSR
jgi:hypothetical protein